jgi:hypothetical protein
MLGEVIDVEASRLGPGEQIQAFGVQLPGVARAIRVDPVEQAEGDGRPAALGDGHGRPLSGSEKAESQSSWMGG